MNVALFHDFFPVEQLFPNCRKLYEIMRKKCDIQNQIDLLINLTIILHNVLWKVRKVTRTVFDRRAVWT